MSENEQEALSTRDWYAPPIKPEHCTRADCCWERSSRVGQRDLGLAKALVQLRSAVLVVQVTGEWPFPDDSLAALETAVHLLRELSNAQWRQMTRPVNTWSGHKPEPIEPGPEQKLKSLNLADLGL